MLKSKTILIRKPDLKLKANHLDTGVSKLTRHWPSKTLGTAVRDGKGWYKPQMKTKRKKERLNESSNELK